MSKMFLNASDQALFPVHLTYLQASLEKVLQNTGQQRLLIHSGAPHLYFLDDRYLPFAVNPHFAWWCPLHSPHSGLLVEPGKRPVLFNYQPVDYWHAAPDEPENWWADHFEIQPVKDADTWLDHITDGTDLAVIGELPLLQERFQLAVHNPTRILHELHSARTRKTDWEISCLAAANRRSVAGHKAVADLFAAKAKSTVSEHELQLHYLRATGHLDTDTPYGNIVALNEHAAVLHFTELSDTPVTPDSLVIDAGATAYGYASDITRTYANAEQPGGADFAALVQTLDELQQTIVAGVRAGVDYRELHLQTHAGIGSILQASGIVNMPVEEMLEHGITSAFLPHGLGHYLGLQVHDVAGLVDDAGDAIERPEGHPFLRLTRHLEAGNVLTIEPGIYIIDQLLQPLREKPYAQSINWQALEQMSRFGGIRIEDDVLVTDAEPRNLSREAFAAHG